MVPLWFGVLLALDVYVLYFLNYTIVIVADDGYSIHNARRPSAQHNLRPYETHLSTKATATITRNPPPQAGLLACVNASKNFRMGKFVQLQPGGGAHHTTSRTTL